MSARDILFRLAEQQGWNVDTQLDLVMEYIENQMSDDAFADFLSEKAKMEQDTVKPMKCRDCGTTGFLDEFERQHGLMRCPECNSAEVEDDKGETGDDVF